MTNTATEPVVPGSLRDTIRREIDGYLRDPLAFPSEFVSWIPQRVEQVGITSPRSNVTGAYTTADTISGLGAAVHGRPTMIRAGAAPYHFMQMTYDDVFAKWVSTMIFTATLGNFTAPGPTATVWTSPTEGTTLQRQHIPGFKALYDAGLRPQTYILAQGASTAGLTHSLRASILGFASGDTNPTVIAHSNGQIDWAGNTGTIWRVSSGWSDVTFDSIPSEAEALLSFQWDTDGAVTFNHVSTMLRWVANPV